MNRTLALLLVTFLGATGLQANFTPSAWHSAPLGTAAATGNEWYSYPDSVGNPRILVKATGGSADANAARKILSGGPPVWSESTAANLALSKQGVFVAIPGGGGYLVAPHANKLQVAIFGSTGSATVEVIDPNNGTYSGISAELDSNGVLHVAYVWNAGTVCYARRNGSPWAFTSVGLPSTTVHNTAIIPVQSTVGTQNFDAYLYYTATASGVRTLWRSKPGVINSQLLIQWGANPRINIENFVGLTLRGSRVGTTGRLFYFGSDNSSSWTFKRHDTAGVLTDLESAGNVSPKSIHVAFGPDGKQRVAWYNESTKSIHYLKPNPVDVPLLAGKPIVLSGTTDNPDLLGLHFGPDGTPYLLYRRDLREGFVAFPKDNFDFNGNGRPEILDTAFNSTVAGPEVLPLQPPLFAFPNTANRFKIRFPTIGNVSSDFAGGLQTSSANLLYRVEVSSGLGIWTPLNFSNISYTNVAIEGPVRTFVGVINEPAPGAFPARFARLKVTRLNYPY